MRDGQTESKPIRRRRKPWQFTLKGLLAFAAIFALLCGLCSPIIHRGRQSAPRASCTGLCVNVIMIALESYHQRHGCYPPAYVADEKGRPMHSWRVLILPDIGREDLYKRYDFGEPWNGPNNRRLIDEMPITYRCPSSRNANKAATSYVGVVGPETAWPGPRSVRRRDIKDNSIMIVEVADSEIAWTEPRDMTLAEAIRGVNVDRKRGISSNHPGGAQCGVTIDLARFLPDGTPPEVIRALLTIRGGERVTWDYDPILAPPEENGDAGRRQ